MSNRISYERAAVRGSVSLDAGALHVGTADALRSWEWSYDLGAHSVANRVRTAREADLTVWATTLAAADLLRDAVELDMAKGEPGRLVVDGEWSQRALFVAADIDSIGRRHAVLAYKVVLLDGAWGREVTRQYVPGSAEASDLWLAYPHPFPHGYGGTCGRDGDVLWVDSPGGDAPVRVVFYGPAQDPHITVGSNLYQWVGTVPAGARLDIDCRGRQRKVTLTRSDGSVEDGFRGAVRQGGLGGGTYAFQPLSDGPNHVGWGGGYGVDLTWVEQSATPPFDVY